MSTAVIPITPTTDPVSQQTDQERRRRNSLQQGPHSINTESPGKPVKKIDVTYRSWARQDGEVLRNSVSHRK